jgi:pyridoxine 5-phosphate synthase
LVLDIFLGRAFILTTIGPRLGVNIDHVATVRQARRATEPDPVWAAALAQLGGADGITVHLREDRRHIQDRDVRLLKQTVTIKLNLESSCTPEMVQSAVEIFPDQVCLVPERREEITTEGGLDVVSQRGVVGRAVDLLRAAGIEVSLFIDPDCDQVRAAADLGAHSVELHTGAYANSRGAARDAALEKLLEASHLVRRLQLGLHAGHGLTYANVIPVASIKGMQELNIGHSIVSRALMVGMVEAVRVMKSLITPAPS